MFFTHNKFSNFLIFSILIVNLSCSDTGFMGSNSSVKNRRAVTSLSPTEIPKNPAPVQQTDNSIVQTVVPEITPEPSGVPVPTKSPLPSCVSALDWSVLYLIDYQSTVAELESKCVSVERKMATKEQINCARAEVPTMFNGDFNYISETPDESAALAWGFYGAPGVWGSCRQDFRFPIETMGGWCQCFSSDLCDDPVKWNKWTANKLAVSDDSVLLENSNYRPIQLYCVKEKTPRSVATAACNINLTNSSTSTTPLANATSGTNIFAKITLANLKTAFVKCTGMANEVSLNITNPEINDLIMSSNNYSCVINYQDLSDTAGTCSSNTILSQLCSPNSIQSCAPIANGTSSKTCSAEGTSWGSCKTECNSNSSLSGSACILNTCQGTTPASSTLCLGDDADLTLNNILKTSVGSCTFTAKCEYACNSGFHLDSTLKTCVVDACTNGADNYPTCTSCPSGKYLNPSNMCVLAPSVTCNMNLTGSSGSTTALAAATSGTSIYSKITLTNAKTATYKCTGMASALNLSVITPAVSALSMGSVNYSCVINYQNLAGIADLCTSNTVTYQLCTPSSTQSCTTITNGTSIKTCASTGLSWGSCLVTCSSGYHLDLGTSTCAANVCTNSAIDYPTCTTCATGKYLSGGTCVVTPAVTAGIILSGVSGSSTPLASATSGTSIYSKITLTNAKTATYKCTGMASALNLSVTTPTISAATMGSADYSCTIDFQNKEGIADSRTSNKVVYQLCTPNSLQSCAVIANGTNTKICASTGLSWGSCAVACSGGFHHDIGTNTCVANVCTNSATDYPTCTSCPTGKYLSGSSCVVTPPVTCNMTLTGTSVSTTALVNATPGTSIYSKINLTNAKAATYKCTGMASALNLSVLSPSVSALSMGTTNYSCVIDYQNMEGIAASCTSNSVTYVPACTVSTTYDPADIKCEVAFDKPLSCWSTGWKGYTNLMRDQTAKWISPLAEVDFGGGITGCPSVPSNETLVYVSNVKIPTTGTYQVNGVGDNAGNIRLWRNGNPTEEVFNKAMPLLNNASTEDVYLTAGTYSIVGNTIDTGVASGFTMSIGDKNIGSVLKHTEISTPGAWCIFRVPSITNLTTFVPDAARCRSCFIGTP